MTIKINNEERKEKRVKQLELACDFIKRQAAELVGNDELPMCFSVSINFEKNCVPTITLNRKLYPTEVLKDDAL